jgi:hypothetical protein
LLKKSTPKNDKSSKNHEASNQTYGFCDSWLDCPFRGALRKSPGRRKKSGNISHAHQMLNMKNRGQANMHIVASLHIHSLIQIFLKLVFIPGFIPVFVCYNF